MRIPDTRKRERSIRSGSESKFDERPELRVIDGATWFAIRTRISNIRAEVVCLTGTSCSAIGTSAGHLRSSSRRGARPCTTWRLRKAATRNVFPACPLLPIRSSAALARSKVAQISRAHSEKSKARAPDSVLSFRRPATKDGTSSYPLGARDAMDNHLAQCSACEHQDIALQIPARPRAHSRPVRSQCAATAAASYVPWRKVRSVASGSDAVRTISYGSRNSRSASL